MFTIKEYVPANEIWSTAEAYIDSGYKPNLVRGYNVEVMTSDGKTDWLSTEWIHGDPKEEFNDDFHQYYYKNHGWKPTGRICFRGYGREVYDPDERDYYIKKIC